MTDAQIDLVAEAWQKMSDDIHSLYGYVALLGFALAVHIFMHVMQCRDYERRLRLLASIHHATDAESIQPTGLGEADGG